MQSLTSTGSEKSTASFRSVDEWKSALMNLPDGNFFELLRSVFGNIKTPFNKQRLLEDLFILLSRNEIRQTIAAYIDERDHKVIAAVAFLNEPAPGDLESFFTGEFSCAELHALIINLEERLILFRFRDEDVLRLALNPVLESILVPFIADNQLLFPGFPVKGSLTNRNTGAHVNGGVDGYILAALVAFFLDQEEPLKTEGGLRKKNLDEGKRFFPGLDLEQAAGTLLHLGLFRTEGRSFLPIREKITEYSGLSSSERQEYWAAGTYLCLDEKEDKTDSAQSGFSRNRLRWLASFIRRFRSLLNPRRALPEITLRRLAGFLERETRETGKLRSSYYWGSPGFPPGSPQEYFSFEVFLAAMEKTGLLIKTENGWRSAETDAPEEKSSGKDKAAAPFMVMDTAFSFILYPEIPLEDALSLGAFCSIKENSGTTIVFELTRQSAVRGFDQGITSEAMTELINRLSHNRIDANLAWSLKEWEKRYAGVSLQQGLVLNLAEDRRYLAEAEPVASLIQKTLAPGVYLLAPEEQPEAIAALKKAGVDIIAHPPSAAARRDGIGSRSASRFSFPRLSLPGQTAISPFPFSKPPVEKTVSVDSIKQQFYHVLDTMRLDKAERKELEARIERRLVLSEIQLKETTVRYEKLEARGLDYVGKAAIAKDAIAAKSLVEVFWSGPGGEKCITGIPQTLEKKGGESILILEDSENAGGVLRIPLGKISLLRRIKQSIFT